MLSYYGQTRGNDLSHTDKESEIYDNSKVADGKYDPLDKYSQAYSDSEV